MAQPNTRQLSFLLTPQQQESSPLVRTRCVNGAARGNPKCLGIIWLTLCPVLLAVPPVGVPSRARSTIADLAGTALLRRSQFAARTSRRPMVSGERGRPFSRCLCIRREGLCTPKFRSVDSRTGRDAYSGYGSKLIAGCGQNLTACIATRRSEDGLQSSRPVKTRELRFLLGETGYSPSTW